MLRPGRGIGGLGGGEGDAVVAPEVPQLLARDRIGERAIVLVEFVHRQQLDRGDAELVQIRNFFDKSGEGAGMGDAAATDGR